MNPKSSVEDSQNLLEPWLAVIGLITVMWSSVERKIDECVVVLFEDSNGKNKPLTLSRKLELIRKKLPLTSIFIEDIGEVFKATKDVAQVRDVCVHGVIESYDSERMVIGKVQGKSKGYKIEMFTFGEKRLHSAGRNLTNLSSVWERLFDEIYAAAKNG